MWEEKRARKRGKGDWRGWSKEKMGEKEGMLQTCRSFQ